MSMSTKPAAQSVGVTGIDAHGRMGSTQQSSPTPDAVLRGGAQDPAFRAFVFSLTSADGPVTYHGTIEAVFKRVGATCWADLQKPIQLRALQALLQAYADSLDAS
jgi:hypothetical protein